MRAPHLHDTLRRFCLGAFAVFTRELEDGVDLPFAFEEHGTYGRPTLYEYRPLVRGFVEARAERLFARVDVQDAVADLLREPAARIFAHAHEGDVQRRAARGLPQRARAAPGAHRRGLRRLRLGRLRLRARVRRARGLALRRGPLLRRGRAADRPLGRHADRARRRDPRAGGRHGRARGDVAGGGGAAAAELRPRARPDLRARARALAGERDERGARRARRARGRGHGDPARHRGAGRRGAGPVRAARLASVRDPSRAADRGDGASGRADAARSRSAPRWRATCGSASAWPTTTRTSATRSTAGSWRSSSRSRSAASSSARRSRPRSGKATEPGPPRCAVPLCSARLRRSAPTSPRSCASRAASLLRRLLVAVLLHGDRRALVRDLDEALLGVTGAVASLQQRAS